MKLIPCFECLHKPFASHLQSGLDQTGVFSTSLHYLNFWDFDEDWYLSNYPDVKSAIAEGAFDGGREHFNNVGYFEGRSPYSPIVDVEWYMSAYPDIAAAIIEGRVSSASEHFIMFGYREGRIPEGPLLQAEWYARRYLPMNGKNSDKSVCLDYYIRVGYLSGALPTSPGA